MSRLFDRSGSIVALALSVPVIVFACSQRPVAEAHAPIAARAGAPAMDVQRWATSGCTTDSDCQDMEDFVAVVCANEEKAACDAVATLMFFRD